MLIVHVVTGASSGFGLEMVRCALAHGDVVAACVRSPAALAPFATQHPPARLLVLPLDVTVPADVPAAFRAALAAFGRVDVVFSNASVVVAGEVEGIVAGEAGGKGEAMERARAMFEANFWGAARVAAEAVRVFREENQPCGGRLIVNSAGAGLVGYPLLGWYCASKHGKHMLDGNIRREANSRFSALEGLTETLGKEVHPDWNIKVGTSVALGTRRRQHLPQVTAVEPGAFQSSLAANRTMAPQHPAYTDSALPSSAMRAAFATPESEAAAFASSDTAKGVEKIYELSLLDDPPRHLPLGPDGVQLARIKVEEFGEEVEKYASWSDDLRP